MLKAQRWGIYARYLANRQVPVLVNDRATAAEADDIRD